MKFARNIPELLSLTGGTQHIRIPPELDVPLTGRVRRLLDSAPFRRLQGISQLGLVRLVYPGAVHTRLEHSLGVYRLALAFLGRLDHDERFRAAVDDHAAGLLIAAALLHDVGHWPFCHPLEDIRLSSLPKHEELAARFLQSEHLDGLLRKDWGISGNEVAALLQGEWNHPASGLLCGILSGPIDIDKMDYLQRDSLHAGVPYGRHFDQARLIGSLCVNAAGTGLAISDKGKTAAEMMVFARYVMFSEVYWHHAVRSATAMLQRTLYEVRDALPFQELFGLQEGAFIERVAQIAAAEQPQIAQDLWEGLFGTRRTLYKRLAQFSYVEHAHVHARMARRSYPWLVRCSQALARILSAQLGESVDPHHILIDAPPVDREVEFRVEVHDRKSALHHPLETVSPVVRVLAKEQFDDFVKRVRVFVHPRWSQVCKSISDVGKLLVAAADEAGSN